MTTMQPRRSDLVRAVNEIIAQRSSTIRALYIISVAANGPREEVLSEFHQAVGDTLEGVGISQLQLKHLDRAKLREEVAWLRERKE